MKAETEIKASITASLKGRAAILVLMYVENFKTDVFFYQWRQLCLTSHWPIIVNIRVSSCACELWTDLIFLWIKVSSVIQTFSVAHIKGKMSNLSIKWEYWFLWTENTSTLNVLGCYYYIMHVTALSPIHYIDFSLMTPLDY